MPGKHRAGKPSPGKAVMPAAQATLAKTKPNAPATAATTAATAATTKPTPSKKTTPPTKTPSKKRIAPAPADRLGTSKKQKTSGIVPVTPGMDVDISRLDATDSVPAGAGKAKDRKQKRAEKKTKQDQPQTLPLEPHAAVLAAMKLQRDVLVLSVLSSSKMEKRITAVLNHLGKPASRLATEGGGHGSDPAAKTTTSATATGTAAKPLPGVVLLHGRADTVNKLTSITEIVKRRIRGGFFGPGSEQRQQTPWQPEKQKRAGTAEDASLAWYQYNRVYSVEMDAPPVRPKKNGRDGGRESHGDKDKDDDKDEDEDEDNSDEDDGFEPIPQHFQEAVGELTERKRVTRMFMSIILSRVPLPELLKQQDITCQTSNDVVEKEYEAWMSGQVMEEP